MSRCELTKIFQYPLLEKDFFRQEYYPELQGQWRKRKSWWRKAVIQILEQNPPRKEEALCHATLSENQQVLFWAQSVMGLDRPCKVCINFFFFFDFFVTQNLTFYLEARGQDLSEN